MEASFFSFTLVLLISNIATFISSATISDSTTDQAALLAFKNAITRDPNDFLTKNWSTNTSICNWTGVTCSSQNTRVSALNISGSGLGGAIAPHLGNLTFLQSLDISNNIFTGSMPSELSKLHNLNDINAGFNNLSGEIPPEFGALSQLQHLNLRDNSFSGRIPSNLFNMSRLQSLDMCYNLLAGNVPEQIGSLSELETLNLANNQLVGAIPSSIFINMSSLIEIDLVNNFLSGRLPSLICSNNNNPKLKIIYLRDNQLEGQIPANIYKCTELEELSLSINQFSGNIPSEIGYLTMLTTLALKSNHLQGRIPSSIFNVSTLEYIDLFNNDMSGSIPTFNNLPMLEELYLSHNNFIGSIPNEIGSITSLKTLQVSNNNLTGPIPKQLGNITSLVWLDITYNKLTGELPEELGNLASLETFAAGFNDFLSGSIPSAIFNISTLKTLALQQNQLSGTLPRNMGLTLYNLKELYLYFNRLSGEIPGSINNASKLTMLELNINSFTGYIPDFGNLRFLKLLRLWRNNLIGAASPTQEIRFLSSLTNCRELTNMEISNNPQLNGVLPASLGNLSASLVTFAASNCSIKGVIPSTVGNLSSLATLDLSANQLTGFIPTTMGKLEQIGKLYLDLNELQGYIPHDLCQMSKLLALDLSCNMFTGPVPGCLGGIKSLQRVFFGSNKLNSTLPSNFLNNAHLIILDLSTNNLSGQLPSQIGNLKAINNLNLSSNHFSGHIPSSIDGCRSLEILDLSNNMFNGSMPESLGNVKGLTSLNMSKNYLSGEIPKSFEKLDLKHLNVSYNQLEGKIPDGGRFSYFTADSFNNNTALCGATRFGVPACGKSHESSRSITFASIMKYIVPPFIAVIIAVFIIVALIKRTGKEKEIPSLAGISLVGGAPWRIVSERELKQGTNSFSETNLLGKGNFGSVFKAILGDETVAVKVFNLGLEGALKSFGSESQILSTIRHRNLVRILGCCSNTEFKALILAYMTNGSLDKWLHSDTVVLDLVQRLKIAIDVALALEYLHHHHTSTVVHCDIKPNNVLLDEDMTAHLGDFGISKLFGDGETTIHTITMATIGYVAPEVGLEGKISISGDVYSYGILLLEMFTGKRPTDVMFKEEMSIKEWVGKAVAVNETSEVMAPGLLSTEDPNSPAKEKCMSSVFELAMKCLAFSPEERISMMQVVPALHKFKVAVEGVRRRHGRPR